jgi:hypothetical protein
MRPTATYRIVTAPLPSDATEGPSSRRSRAATYQTGSSRRDLVGGHVGAAGSGEERERLRTESLEREQARAGG